MSSLSAFTEGLKNIVARLKGYPDSRGAARIRAAAKAAMRNSPTNAMQRFKECIAGDPACLKAFEAGDLKYFEENGEALLTIKGSRSLWEQMDEASRACVWSNLTAMFSAAFARDVEKDAEWSAVFTVAIGKQVDISAETGVKINEVIDMLLAFARAQLAEGPQKADPGDLEGLDLSELSPEAPEPSEMELQLRQLISGLTDGNVPEHISSAEVLQRMPETLDYPGAKPVVSALRKICKKVDGTIIESLLSKVAAQISTESMDRLIGSIQNVDLTVVSREVRVLTGSVQKQEVIDSLRGMMADADPKVLKAMLTAAVGSKGGSGTEAVKSLLKSNLFANVASQLPAVLNADGSLNIDKLIEAIKKPRKTPAPPRLSHRR